MNRLLAPSNHLFIGDKDKSLARGEGFERACMCICHYGLRSCCSKRMRAFGFIMSSLRETYVS